MDGSAADELLQDVTRPVALVNVSGLLAGRVDQTEEYVRIVADLRGRGLHVLVIPHVDREQSGDMEACAPSGAGGGAARREQRALDPVPGSGPRADRPGQHHGDRSHAPGGDVAAARRPGAHPGVPGQGRGPDAAVRDARVRIDAVPGFSAAVIEVVDRVLPEDSAARRSIRQALPGVVAMAQRNTADLPASVPTGQA